METPLGATTHRLLAENTREVQSRPGVTAHPDRLGGTELRERHPQLGHQHDDRLADLPVPRGVRDEPATSGRTRPHHVLPDSRCASVGPHQQTQTGRRKLESRRSSAASSPGFSS
ncbi:MAG: DUF5519 family protein [Solirubrobacterales bacterium]|nr:DUF5519 family protein [Solirubrobacterales bacterium]